MLRLRLNEIKLEERYRQTDTGTVQVEVEPKLRGGEGGV
jgi:hypothetical protein